MLRVALNCDLMPSIFLHIQHPFVLLGLMLNCPFEHIFNVILQVRKGVLPRLLEEILSTRIMVKKAMKKLSASQKVLQRVFTSKLFFKTSIHIILKRLIRS